MDFTKFAQLVASEYAKQASKMATLKKVAILLAIDNGDIDLAKVATLVDTIRGLATAKPPGLRLKPDETPAPTKEVVPPHLREEWGRDTVPIGRNPATGGGEPYKVDLPHVGPSDYLRKLLSIDEPIG